MPTSRPTQRDSLTQRMDDILEKFNAIIPDGALKEYCSSLVQNAMSSSAKHAGDTLWNALGMLEGLERETAGVIKDVMDTLGTGDFIRARRRAGVISTAREHTYELWEFVLCATDHPRGLADAVAKRKFKYFIVDTA